MRLALLRNPDSGAGAAGDVAGMLRAHASEVQVFDADEADRSVDPRPDRLVVAGGDGSIGAAADAAARAGVPLAVIPAGTANDFARALGLPDDLEKAARIAAVGTKTRHVDLGRMGARPFVNVASLGLPPAAARSAHGLKRLLGPAAYVVGGIRAAATADPVGCRARCDGEEVFVGDAWQVTVACSGAFGGGNELDADPQDGRLDLVVIEAGSRAALALRAFGLRRGTVETQQGVKSWRGREVDLDAPAGTSFNVDGELVEAGGTSFRVEPGAVCIVVG